MDMEHNPNGLFDDEVEAKLSEDFKARRVKVVSDYRPEMLKAYKSGQQAIQDMIENKITPDQMANSQLSMMELSTVYLSDLLAEALNSKDEVAVMSIREAREVIREGMDMIRATQKHLDNK